VTPEQEEQVRRALASAPPAGAMPPEVAARLDATLADLVAGRSTGDSAPVVALEERRRRRWPRVLVAAASVSVLAYGVGIALDGLQVSGGGAESTAARDETFAGAGADSADGGAEAAPEDAPTGLVEDSDGVKVQGSRAYADKLLVPGTVRLRAETLDEDVRRLVGVGVADARTPSPRETRGHAGFLDSCEQPDLDRGDRVAAVRLDGRPATLVVRKAVDGTRVAQIYACGDASDLLATTRVPDAR
jgi:hypothetical protein